MLSFIMRERIYTRGRGRDLLHCTEVNKLWLDCSNYHFKRLGQSTKYQFLTLKRAPLSNHNIREVVHRIYCCREIYDLDIEDHLSLLHSNTHRNKFTPGFIIFGDSFGFEFDTCFLDLRRSQHILHSNHNSLNSFAKDIGSTAGIVDPITRDVIAIGGWNERSQIASSTIQHLNTSTFESSEAKSSLSFPRCYSAAQSTSKGDVIVIGGGSSPYQGAEVFNTCSIRKSSSLDTTITTWYDNVIPNMYSVRCGHSAVSTFDGNIVVVGGYAGGRNYLDTVEMLDQNLDRWIQLPSMQSSRSGMIAITSPKGSVYVAGGSIDGTVGLKTVERFDTREGKWQYVANMNLARGYLSGDISCQEEFIVCGGVHNSIYQRGLESYDFRMNKWVLLSDDIFSEKELSYLERACHQMLYVW